MADFTYQPHIIMAGSDDREIIALKFIESMTFDIDDTEELVIEALKGDRHLVCTMVSGKEYRVSMLAQIKCFKKYELPAPKELLQAIFDKWYHIISTT